MKKKLKPTSGSVYINGEELTGQRAKELKKQVGIVFQYPEHQLFEETVYKDIAFGLVRRGEENLQKSKKNKSPFELSGGQKMVLEPSILVLDEPAAGLDGREEIFELVSNLHKKILVSHSMEDVAKYVQRVIVMNQGRIEMCGPVRSVFKNTETLEEIGLAAPQITYLMKKLKEKIPQINDDILTIAEAKEELAKYIRKA